MSVVVPALNEAPNLGHLYERIASAFARVDEDFELLFVDDGSWDGTKQTLEALHNADARVKALVLSRNFGQGAAITAGIEYSGGDAIIVMDADGQDPPELIPALLAKWREGHEIVGGRRTRRVGQSWTKRAAAYLFYRVMRALVGWDLPMDTGEFRLIDRAAANAFLACRQRHRLVRTLTSWAGFRQTTIDYEHGVRHSGTSKYTLRSSLRLALTSITAFSLVPLRIAFVLGLLIVFGALLAAGVLATWWLADSTFSWLSLSLVGLWFVAGFQCLMLGILGEYVGRTYMETQHRPICIVREAIGLPDSGRKIID